MAAVQAVTASSPETSSLRQRARVRASVAADAGDAPAQSIAARTISVEANRSEHIRFISPLPRAKEIASPTRDMTTVPNGGVETAVHTTNEARRRFSCRNRADAQSQGDDGTAFEDQVDSDEKPNGPKAREGPASEKETSKDRAHESVEHVKPFALDVRG